MADRRAFRRIRGWGGSSGRASGGGTVRGGVAAAPSGVGAAGLALLLLATLPEAAAAQELPDGVTPETVERGRRIYRGDGFCDTCHGPEGEGLEELGAELTSGAWTYSDGSLQGLIRVIREGVPAERSATGIPMPPLGGADLDADELRAVAAYVWTLSRDGPGGTP